MSFYSVFREMRGYYDSAGPSAGPSSMDRVLLAKDALTFRSTSQPSDEGLCLGNIIGVPARPLVAARTHGKRMKYFWEAVAEDPTHYHASLIFFPGPKLADRGWRWAPATMMDGSVSNGQMAGRRLDGLVLGRSRLGLHVRLPALTFTKLLLRDFDHLFYLRVSESSPSGDQTVRHLVLHLGDQHGAEDERGHRPKRLFSKSRRFIVLLPFSPSEMGRMLVAVGTTDVMLAVASLRGNNRVHLVMPAQVTAVDTIANDLSRLHEIDQKSGKLFVVDAEPGLDEIVPRPWITASLVRNGYWHVD